MRKLNKENVKDVRNVSGLYKIYNAKGALEYVGVSTMIQRRLQRYYQKDDFVVHPTKRALRPHAKQFEVFYMTIGAARSREKKLKGRTPHNKL